MIKLSQNIFLVSDSGKQEVLNTLVSKLLDWPFLLFLGLVIFCWWFRDEIKKILERGDVQISWGENKSIRLGELSQNIDQELEPIRDDIEALKQSIATLDIKSESLSKTLSEADVEKVQEKLLEALNNPKFKWRSIERLAAISGVSESQVLDILRNDPDVRLTIGKSQRQIAGLKSRVGNGESQS